MSINLKFKIAPIALAMAVGLPTSSIAIGQTMLEEIVVTARKVEESLQDVPLAISAFSADDISDRSIEELEDIALYTPGLTFEDYSNGGYGTPVIRGASQFDIDALEKNVSTFIDGVYIPRQYALDLGSVGMERIEVVKGPQSALYGANAFTGAINYVTKKADLEEFYADVTLDVGSDGRLGVSGEVSIPVVEDVLAIKLNGSSSEFDGDWENEHPRASEAPSLGTDETMGGWEKDSYGISVIAQPTEALNLEFAYNSFESFLEARAQARLGAGDFDLNCGGLLFGFAPNNYCGELPETPVANGTGESIGFIFDPRSYSKSESTITRFAASFDATDEISISYQYGGIDGDVYSAGNTDSDPLVGSLPFGGVAGQEFNSLSVLPTGDFDYTTHELRLEYTADSGFYAMIGVFDLDGEDLDFFAGFEAPLWNTVDTLEPVTREDLDPILVGGALTETESTAVFGRVEFPVIEDSLSVSIEARLTQEEKTASDSTGEYTYDDDFFTPRITLDYNLNEDSMVYFSAAKGVKAGGINEAVQREGGFGTPFLALPDDERFFDPEENTTLEIGTKNILMDGQLQLNAALYTMDWSDLQVSVASVQAASPTTQVITGNEGSATSTGMELDFSYLATESLSINGGIAIIDATYDDGVISQRIVRAGVCDDVVCNADGDIGGNDLPRSSDTQWNIGAQYDGSLNNGLEFFLRADLVGQSEQYAAPMNTATLPSRTLLNLRGGVSSENWSAELWVTNATDEEYVSNAFYIASPFFVDYVPTWGNLQRMGLTVDYSF